MSLDIAKIAERLAQLNSNSGGNGGGFSYLKLKDGRNVVRILPPAPGKDMFYSEVFMHYGINKTEENKKGVSVVCPTTLGDNKPCPVCELTKSLWQLSKSKEDSYQKQAKRLGRKKRVYFNVIDRGDDLSKFKKNDEGKWINTDTNEEESPIKIMSTGVGILKDILGFIVDPEYGDITDAEKGLDVIITKSGTGLNTNYDVKTVRKESAIGFDNWEENLNDLNSLGKCKSYDDLKQLLEGTDPEADVEEDSQDIKSQDTPVSTPVSTPTSTATPNDVVPNDAVPEGNAEDDVQAEILAALQKRKGKDKK